MIQFFGWLLTGVFFVIGAVITGAIGFAWQRRSWLFDQKMTYAKDQYQKKTELTSYLFGLISERLYATRNYIAVLRTKNEKEIAAERERYRVVVTKWNVEFPPAVIKMKYVFTASQAYSFDHYFPPEFARIDALLGFARRNAFDGDIRIEYFLDEAAGIAYIINAEAGNFSSRLLSSAESQKEYIENKPEIKYSNIDSLTHAYLFKSLFKTRPL